MRAAFENLSLIFVATLGLTERVDRLASSAWERTREPPDGPAFFAAITFARSLTVPALSRVSVTAALASLCFFFALSLWTGLGCCSTRKAPLMNGCIRQKYV